MYVKFEEELSRASKNDIRNFGAFWLNTQKSQHLHFNGHLLTKVYNVWAKKVLKSYVSCHWRVVQYL